MDGDLGSLLCAAVQNRNLSEVRRLVARGADVNSRDPRPGRGGRTALHLAASRDPAILEFLLQNGASTNLPCHNGVFPLHTAARYHSGTLEVLLAAPDIDVNAKWSYGRTPLHYVVDGVDTGTTNVERAVSCLIEAGADVDAVTYSRRSALDLALDHGLREAVKILLRAGAKTGTEVLQERTRMNAAAFAVYDRVKAAGDWNAYARQHQRLLAGLVRKCAQRLPGDAARHVVSFWTPPGGYFMRPEDASVFGGLGGDDTGTPDGLEALGDLWGFDAGVPNNDVHT